MKMHMIKNMSMRLNRERLEQRTPERVVLGAVSKSGRMCYRRHSDIKRLMV